MRNIWTSRLRTSLANRFRIAIVLLAICSLTGSVATRYTALGPNSEPDVQKVTAVKSQIPDAKRQHLLANGLQWSAPAPSFTLYQPPRSAVFAVSVVVPPTNLNSESWLYNRPPPSSC
jgi:hypothetical protein